MAKQRISTEREAQLVKNSLDRLEIVGKYPPSRERTTFLKREANVLVKRSWSLWCKSTSTLRRAVFTWCRIRIFKKEENDV